MMAPTSSHQSADFSNKAEQSVKLTSSSNVDIDIIQREGGHDNNLKNPGNMIGGYFSTYYHVVWLQ